MKYPDWSPPVKPVTVKCVYGVDDPVLPAGFEATGEFRQVVKGDHYLPRGTNLWGADLVWTSSIPSVDPRIIIRPVPRVVFTFVGKRAAQFGEWFKSNNNEFRQWLYSGPSTFGYNIYTRSEE